MNKTRKVNEAANQQTFHPYSELSVSLTKQLDKETKKKNGIYFTPPDTIRNKIMPLIEPYLENIHCVLEPSCGSGEFISALLTTKPELEIHGIEYNEQIHHSVQREFQNNPKITIHREDLLRFQNGDVQYDCILGNPPYFVMKKNQVDKKYHSYFDGRPNIFVLFIIKSLEMLKEGGVLCFVLPKSVLNCIYYDKLRKHIHETCVIKHIQHCEDKYLETQQDTIILLLEKRAPPLNWMCPFVLQINNYTVFGDEYSVKKINELTENTTNLQELGCVVSVGKVVWNENKDILTEDTTKTRLIYSSDISNGSLVEKYYSNASKKNYIDKKGQRNPLLVINRGYGVGNYKFDYCLIDVEFEYLVENHLICISCGENAPREQQLELYKRIIGSFENKKTEEFIKLYFGNGAINTTELNTLLPIYL